MTKPKIMLYMTTDNINHICSIVLDFDMVYSLVISLYGNTPTGRGFSILNLDGLIRH